MSYNTMYKAAQQFAKHSYKAEQGRAFQERRNPRPGVMGAKRYHHPDDPKDAMRQYISDGYVCVSYSQPLPDLLEYEPECTVAGISGMFLSALPCHNTYRGAPLPSLKAVRALWTEEKRRSKHTPKANNNKYRLVPKSDDCAGVIVNIEKLILFMLLTNCKGGEYFYYDGPISPVLVENDLDDNHIEGVLMPLRVHYTDQCLNDEQEAETHA